jgi:hypothetical protein
MFCWISGKAGSKPASMVTFDALAIIIRFYLTVKTVIKISLKQYIPILCYKKISLTLTSVSLEGLRVPLTTVANAMLMCVQSCGSILSGGRG